MEFVRIQGMRWSEIAQLTSRRDIGQPEADFALRVSFFDSSLDTEMCPIVYSAERMVSAQVMNDTEQEAASREIPWSEHELPNLVTAYNSVNLAKQCSLLMLVWMRVNDGRACQEQLIGQARIKMNDLGSYMGNELEETFSLGQDVELSLGNKLVGTVASKIRFKKVTTL